MQITKEDTIEQWIRQATDASGFKRRRFKRYPIFQPSTIHCHNDAEVLPAFVRDISRVGVGLVHQALLPIEMATLHLTRPAIKIVVDLKYCYSVDDKWHLSYGEFVGLSTAEKAKLAFKTATEGVNQRLAQRQPFFRPMSLTVCATHDRIPAVFSRDISSAGIGLFHSTPLDNQSVLLRIAGADDASPSVRAKIRWCRPCDNGWFISGASFDRLLLEELECRLA